MDRSLTTLKAGETLAKLAERNREALKMISEIKRRSINEHLKGGLLFYKYAALDLRLAFRSDEDFERAMDILETRLQCLASGKIPSTNECENVLTNQD